jgi:hypothetical protein
MDSTETPSRPGWVWIIAIWFIFGTTVSLLALNFGYFRNLTAFDYGITLLIGGLNLLGTVLLLLLRKAALYLFCGSLIANILLPISHAVTNGWVATNGIGGEVRAMVGFVILCVVCLYLWRLSAKGVLK